MVRASVIIIYFNNNRIILTSDSRVVGTFEKERMVYSNNSSCKIRVVNNCGIGIVGTVEGSVPIKYDVWHIVQQVFNKYSYEEALNVLNITLSNLYPIIGKELSKSDLKYQNATDIDGPIILSIAIARKINDSLKLQILHLGYLNKSGKPSIKIANLSFQSAEEKFSYYSIGVELTPAIKEHIENNVDLNSYKSMGGIIDFVSLNNSRTVGGECHILEVNKNGFKWKPNDPCR